MNERELVDRIACAPMPETAQEALRQLADVALLWALKIGAMFHVKHHP
jgi:hypothetical protein